MLYFVSYTYKTTEHEPGFGSAFVEVSNEITGSEDMDNIVRSLEKSFRVTAKLADDCAVSITVLFFKKMSK